MASDPPDQLVQTQLKLHRERLAKGISWYQHLADACPKGQDMYLCEEDQEWHTVRWDSDDDHSGVISSTVSAEIMTRAKLGHWDIQAVTLYGIKPSQGYWLEIPSADDNAYSPPMGRVPVYLAHLYLGVRFPLHPFIVELLEDWQLSLA